MIANDPPTPSASHNAHSRDLMTLKWLVGPVALAVVLLAFGGQDWVHALRYDRSGIARGELWRLLTGHLVHLSAWHLILNLLGLALIGALFTRAYSVLQWAAIAAASVAAIGAGLFILRPQIDWYVGLSGVLHGLMAAGAVAWWRSESRPLAGALSLVLIAKLTWEQIHGALPLAGSIPVVVDAHLYGAMGGFVCAAAIVLLTRRARVKP
jgi:rhomboid family GlyGly-CTERM serine protease